MKTARARFKARCGQCRAEIRVGDQIARPETKNAVGGRAYVTFCLCPACATDVEELGDEGGRYLTYADREADQARRAPIARRMQERREQHEGGR